MLEEINKRSIMLGDRERWLEIMQMFYAQFKDKQTSPETRVKLKEMIKFCGEQSKELKDKLAKMHK